MAGTPYVVLSGNLQPGQSSDPASGFSTVDRRVTQSTPAVHRAQAACWSAWMNVSYLDCTRRLLSGLVCVGKWNLDALLFIAQQCHLLACVWPYAVIK